MLKKQRKRDLWHIYQKYGLDKSDNEEKGSEDNDSVAMQEKPDSTLPSHLKVAQSDSSREDSKGRG